MFKKILSLFLAIMMIVAMIPLNNAYAGTAVPAMDNVLMKSNYQYMDLLYDFSNENTPLPKKGTGPLYDDIFFTDPDAYWTRKIDNTIGYVTPGERPTGSFGFCIDLKKSRLLGAVKKGDLYAECTVNARNYDYDGDFGKAVIIPYSSGGAYLTEYSSAEYDMNNKWGNISLTSPYIRSDAYYLIFSAYGERRGGVLNKALNFDVHSIYGKIIDKTPPKVVGISDTATDQYGNQFIRQDINKNDPSIYVTMDEDCTFDIGNKVILTRAADGFYPDKYEVSANLIYVGEEKFDYSTGNVTYKFRIDTSQIFGYHYDKLRLSVLNAKDTLGNRITQSMENISQLGKVIDLGKPYWSHSATNKIGFRDDYGLSNVGYSVSLGSITNIINIYDVGDTEKQEISNAVKNKTIEIPEQLITGNYYVNAYSYDLAKNSSSLYFNVFSIGNSDPIKFTLQNSTAHFAISENDVKADADFALTNMTLKVDTSVIPKEKLSSAEIRYKWSSVKNDSILTENPSTWQVVKFKREQSGAYTGETEQIKIPVKSDITGEFLQPLFAEGYLYVIPYMHDDVSGIKYRTGSLATPVVGITGEPNKVNLLQSYPLNGIFTNLGCECTGQTPSGDTVESHYAAVRNHTKEIGFVIDASSKEKFSKIKWFISRKGDTSSYLTPPGLTEIKDFGTGKFSIPISDISNSTGSYTFTLALYSIYGDVTVKKIDVNIESPNVSCTNVLYNEATQNLDFTINYNKKYAVLSDVQIEICGRDITAFKENILNEEGSIYAGAVLLEKDKWDTGFGDNTLVRTEFSNSDPANPDKMSASFRASLTNMEKAGDEFIKLSGEKRVHLKYLTANNVQVFNNNITVIKKTNIPPSVMLIKGTSDLYKTATDYNSEPITVRAEEILVDMTKLNYGWVENIHNSLVTTSGAINGTAVAISSNKIEFSAQVPDLEGDELYKTYYLAVYSENSSKKHAEKIYGPFHVLNEQINSKRFLITATDKAIDERSVLIAVDDRLSSIEGLIKADMVKTTWKHESGDENRNVVKKYAVDFTKEEGTTNVSVINIPYPDLVDTDGMGGNYTLDNIEVFNSSDNLTIFKSFKPLNIVHHLPEYFVTINNLPDHLPQGVHISASQDNTEISYGWIKHPWEIPENWTTARTGTSGFDITHNFKKNIFNNSIYMLAKAWNNIYRSDELTLPDTALENIDAAISSGKSSDGHLFPIIIELLPENMDKLAKVEVFDHFSTTSGTAIKLTDMYKISDSKAVGMAALVTSGSAISCNVVINGFDKGNKIESEINETYAAPVYSISNRTITLTNKDDYLKYKLISKSGTVFSFNMEGTAEVFYEGDYLLIYDDGIDFYKLTFDSVQYSESDITAVLKPATKPEEKTTGPVTASIYMPLGAVIEDKYGVVTNVEYEGTKTIATAVFYRNASYRFNIKFANGYVLPNPYGISINYIDENFAPEITAVTSSSAITYLPAGPEITNEDVTASLNPSMKVINNNGINSHTFNRNGKYSFIVLDEDKTLKEYVAATDWIDKICPVPKISKYVWYDTDDDSVVDVGEKTIQIPEGFKTKQNIIVEIEFPHVDLKSRPVKINGSSEFTKEDVFEANTEYAYKYVLPYKPSTSETNPIWQQNLTFTDILGNSMNYNLLIDEIDRNDLLTQLNYSTTDFTNRDVVVSMLSNKPIKRFEVVEVIDGDGNIEQIEKNASPTYVFKENGTKDFNYREINVVQPDLEEGTLTANVTWINKRIPVVYVEYSKTVTNKPVEIKFTIVDGVSENAKLKNGLKDIVLAPCSSGNDLTGTMTVSSNGKYSVEVSNKYGNTGTIIVPVTNIDMDPPLISINGREAVYIKVGEKYYDKGATAFDKRDGDVTKGLTVTGSVDTSAATGNSYYTLTYTATDTAGNTSSKTRRVHVLDISSAVAVVENEIVDLKSQAITNIKIPSTGTVYIEFVGIEGNYTAKYKKGESESYDNSYFKRNGSFLSKLGTMSADSGIYTLFVQDQERNTRIIKLNFYK